MKTSQLPPVRVEPEIRQEIESCLREGETLSAFIESAALHTARARRAQDEFLERGRASLARARLSGELYPARELVSGMRDRLTARAAAQKKATAKV